MNLRFFNSDFTFQETVQNNKSVRLLLYYNTKTTLYYKISP